MAKVNVEKLDEQKKIAILTKAIEKLGLSYVSRQIGVDRSTLNRYVNGKIRNSSYGNLREVIPRSWY